MATLPMRCGLALGEQVSVFEPAEVNYRMLNQHLSDNSICNDVVLPWLAGETDQEEVPFYEESEASGMNSVIVGKTHERF